MKKIILSVASLMFVGVSSSVADNPNACHFKSGENYYNGSQKTIERTWGSGQESTKESNKNGGGKIGTSGTGLNYNQNSRNSNSSSASYITKSTSQECCTSDNKCEDTYYKKGHRDDAVNAVKW